MNMRIQDCMVLKFGGPPSRFGGQLALVNETIGSIYLLRSKMVAHPASQNEDPGEPEQI
jgi:hypothetical protein